MNAKSIYYQAYLTKEFCWMVTSSLRYSEYVAFDRCVDPATSLFEFFVAPQLEQEFLLIMKLFQDQSIVHQLERLPSRL